MGYYELYRGRLYSRGLYGGTLPTNDSTVDFFQNADSVAELKNEDSYSGASL